MELAQFVAELVGLLLPIIAFGMMFGGIPAALLVFLLRVGRPERSSPVWIVLASGAGAWCVAGACIAARFVFQFAAAEPIERFGKLSVGASLWLAAFVPGFAALVALWRHRPSGTPRDSASYPQRQGPSHDPPTPPVQ